MKKGRVADVQAYELTPDGPLVKADPGGRDAASIEHFGPPGDDSPPLPGVDKVQTLPSDGHGTEAAAGYFDTVNDPTAQPGEKLLRGRAADGTPVCQIFLKGDGSLVIESLNGAPMTLKSTGPVTVDSPDVRLTNAAGKPIARVGDIVTGSVNVISTAPGTPAAPGPPDPITAIPFVSQIVSGNNGAKA